MNNRQLFTRALLPKPAVGPHGIWHSTWPGMMHNGSGAGLDVQLVAHRERPRCHLNCTEVHLGKTGVGPIEVHQGFYQGAKRQLPDIQSVVAAHAKTGGKRLPVRHDLNLPWWACGTELAAECMYSWQRRRGYQAPVHVRFEDHSFCVTKGVHSIARPVWRHNARLRDRKPLSSAQGSLHEFTDDPPNNCCRCGSRGIP